MGQSGKNCLHGGKIIPPKWDLLCVQVISHLGGVNPFSYKRFIFTKWNIPFCRDLTQVRRFNSYKQLLSQLISINYRSRKRWLHSHQKSRQAKHKKYLLPEMWLTPRETSFLIAIRPFHPRLMRHVLLHAVDWPR